MKKKEQSTVLSQVNSGYGSKESDWHNFLICWLKQNRSSKRISIISTSPQTGKKSMEESSLPESKSLKDFYHAYSNLGGKFLEDSENDDIGFFHPRLIDTVSKFSPYFVEVMTDCYAGLSESDDAYFKYGVNKDYSFMRSEYLHDALVLGRHGPSYDDFILIFPNVRSTDDEFETGYFSVGRLFRTPSFAEMVRQLHYLEHGKTGRQPPYSQQVMSGSCTDFLLPKDINWI